MLIIDDDENIRDTIGLMLEREHFLPVFASDGRSGLEKALVSKPSLLLVDLRLPDMSGFEVCKQVRAANIETPIIVLSGVGDEVDKVLLLETGADDYVVKPFGGREHSSHGYELCSAVPLSGSRKYFGSATWKLIQSGIGAHGGAKRSS